MKESTAREEVIRDIVTYKEIKLSSHEDVGYVARVFMRPKIVTVVRQPGHVKTVVETIEVMRSPWQPLIDTHDSACSLPPTSEHETLSTVSEFLSALDDRYPLAEVVIKQIAVSSVEQ